MPPVEQARQAIPEGKPLQFGSLVCESLLSGLALRNVSNCDRQHLRLAGERVDDKPQIRLYPASLTVRTPEATVQRNLGLCRGQTLKGGDYCIAIVWQHEFGVAHADEILGCIAQHRNDTWRHVDDPAVEPHAH